jgi:hypothetical protein
MTNFLESASEELISQYYQILMERMLYHLNNNIVFVKEAVLSALGAFSECCVLSFASQYDDIINIIFNIF